MSHILKNWNETKHEDKYNTASLSIMQKSSVYDRKLQELKGTEQFHKEEVANLKALDSSSLNVLNFKLDEMTKKMKNEIYRIKEEARRHDESQKSENNKIQNQINHIKENCDGLGRALREILDRVVNLEKTLGPIA
jgi:hypothetical protein